MTALLVNEELLQKIVVVLKEDYEKDSEDVPIRLLGKTITRQQIIQEFEGRTDWARMYLSRILETMHLAKILGKKVDRTVVEIMKRAGKYD